MKESEFKKQISELHGRMDNDTHKLMMLFLKTDELWSKDKTGKKLDKLDKKLYNKVLDLARKEGWDIPRLQRTMEKYSEYAKEMKYLCEVKIEMEERK